MQNLFNVLTESVNGSTFVSLDTSTVPTLTGGKANPMQGRITKITEGSQVMVFQNKNGSAYDNMVVRRLEQEGKNPYNFQLQPRKWGSRIPNTCFIEHQKGDITRYYLEVIFLKPGRTTYLLDGQPIEAKDIQGLRSSSEGEQGGLDNKVIIRTYAVENITRITVAKRTLTADEFYMNCH